MNAHNAHVWRGIDWRDVGRIERAPGGHVVVYMIDGTVKTLSHYPGEGTYQRAEMELAYRAKRGAK